MLNVPNPGANAPRPKHQSSEDLPVPDMDHPPASTPGDQTGFDRGTAAADQVAREENVQSPDSHDVSKPDDEDDED